MDKAITLSQLIIAIAIPIVIALIGILGSVYATWTQRRKYKADSAAVIEGAALRLIKPYQDEVERLTRKIKPYQVEVEQLARKIKDYECRIEKLEKCEEMLKDYEGKFKELDRANVEKDKRISVLETEVEELREMIVSLGHEPPPRRREEK